MKRIAVLGGTFDPVHTGHLCIARTLVERFSLDRFVFLPAFHAPHKPDRAPTSEYHRFAMLSLATSTDPKLYVSKLELAKRKSRYTVETLPELMLEYLDCKLFFVMGADSWMDITTWRDWATVLTMSDHIVVTRPGYDLSFVHVGDEIGKRVIDLRSMKESDLSKFEVETKAIYVTDTVQFDTSATTLREDLSDGDLSQKGHLPAEVAKYIEKYELYS